MTLSKFIIFLFLVVFTCQQYETDLYKCITADENQCQSVSISNNFFECCQIFTDYYGNPTLENYDFSMCLIYTTTKITQEIIQQAQNIFRESMGFSYTMIGSDYYNYYSFKQTYKCPSQTFTIDYNIGTFTNEELEIFRKDNYCLKLYYQGLADMGLIPSGILNLEKKAITKDDCSKAVVFPSSQDFATCAYATYDFKLYNGSTKRLTTCLYISKNAFDTKALDQHLEQSFKAYSTIDGVSILSYKIEINDKNGKSLSYDSQTKTLASISSNSNNKEEITRISKLFILILMIYLL